MHFANTSTYFPLPHSHSYRVTAPSLICVVGRRVDVLMCDNGRLTASRIWHNIRDDVRCLKKTKFLVKCTSRPFDLQKLANTGRKNCECLSLNIQRNTDWTVLFGLILKQQLPQRAKYMEFLPRTLSQTLMKIPQIQVLRL